MAGSIPSRYLRLHERLRSAVSDSLRMTFDELDGFIDGGTPDRARRHTEWWTNNPSRAYARSWLHAGFVAEWYIDESFVIFVRGEREAPSLAELARSRELRRTYMVKSALRAPSEMHVSRGWWLPHVTYLVHLPRLQRFKVGVTRVGSRRLRDFPGGARQVVVVHLEPFSDRFAATVAECDVLELTEPWRDLGDPGTLGAGYTEMWSDLGPIVDLAVVGASVRRELRDCRLIEEGVVT